MRAVFVLGHANPFPGAAWARVRAHAEALASSGDRVDIVGLVTPKGIRHAGIRRQDAVRLLNLVPGLSTNRAIGIAANVVASLLSAALVWRLRPDVVILSVPPGASAVGGFLGARLARAKTVLDYRDAWEEFAVGQNRGILGRRMIRGLAAWMNRMYRACDLAVSVTPPLVESLVARGVRNPRLHPNGADTFSSWRAGRKGDRSALGLAEGEVVLAYVGAVGGYYRLDVVVRAIARLPKDLLARVRLIVIGPGEGAHWAAVERIASESGISERVHYAGVRHEPAGVMEVLAAADVGLIPYDDNPLWKSALPTKFHEYCAAGLPVVATAWPDSLLATMIEKHGVGRVAPPLDVDGLAAALASLLTDEGLRRACGFKARQLATQYDRRVVAGAFASEVRGLAGER